MCGKVIVICTKRMYSLYGRLRINSTTAEIIDSSGSTNFATFSSVKYTIKEQTITTRQPEIRLHK